MRKLPGMFIRPRRRAFTLVEMMVVLTIIGVLSLMSAGIFSGPVQYYRARRSMENLLWDLRKIQQKARSRGYSQGAQFGVFGLMFYKGQVNPNGVGTNTLGYSYLVYGPVQATPTGAIAALPQNSPDLADLAHVVNIDLSLNWVSVGGLPAQPPVNPLPNSRIQFTQDIKFGNADLVPDNNSMNTGDGMLAIPGNRIDFQLENNEGFFRIEIERQRFIGLQYFPL